MTLCVLTGASRGVGRATALGLAERGTRLCLLGRRSAALDETLRLLDEARRSLGERGAAAVETIECELSAPDAVERAASEVLERCGAPDVVIHNAGIVERQSLEALEDEVWRRQLNVNLEAPMRLTRAFLPSMRSRGSGRVLFVSSISAYLGSAQQAPYNVSKAGLLALMRCLAEELSDSGLMTCALVPGAIDTDMLRGSPYPPRMTAEEVARTLCFLALDAGRAHNGGVVEMLGV
ncbi:MAG TPA: SDR family oxidoreductase [Polyangiaceae bacterium]|nr:SDR family oxidoreductase [Polyangiaceae bacterium]